ncbi:MAG: hypothetical protein U0169_10325 [Polyangiaceae bacterium]
MSASENDTDPQGGQDERDFVTTEPDGPLPFPRVEAQPTPASVPPPPRSRPSPASAPSAPPPSSGRKPVASKAASERPATTPSGKPPPKQTPESSGEASAAYYGTERVKPAPLSNVDMRDEPSVIVAESAAQAAPTARIERDDVQRGLAEVAARAAQARAAGLPTARTAMKTVVSDPRVVAKRSMVAVVAGLAVVLFMLGGVWWTRREVPRSVATVTAEPVPAFPATPRPDVPPAVAPPPVPNPPSPGASAVPVVGNVSPTLPRSHAPPAKAGAKPKPKATSDLLEE